MAPTSIKDDRGFTGLFPIGTLIDARYEIVSEGKMGGMGMVYKCKDIKHARLRDVALKLMQPKLLDSRGAVERFRHEASISRDLLHHPNIVRVYHDDEWQDDSGVVWYYLLMEWVEGRTLRDLIDERKKAGRPFSAWEAYRIISQLAGALSYAHNHREKVIHRDVKPENILFTDEATLSLKLADFGIAKIVNPGDLTRVNTLLGVSPYMSPELKEGSPDVDHRTDIYSTGVVLYELFTLDSTIGPYCPSELNSVVPKEVDAIYKKAVAPRAEQRYQDIKALSDDLLLEARKEGVRTQAGRREDGARRKSMEAPGEKKGIKAVIIAFIVAVVLAGVVAAYVGYRGRQEDVARESRQAALTEQEKADKERQLEEKRKEDEARAQAEAKKSREAEREREARQEEKAKKSPSAQAKPSPPKAAAKEDISAKIKRWQKRLKLATLPDQTPATKGAQSGVSTPAEETRKAPEPDKRQTQTQQEPEVLPQAPPKTSPQVPSRPLPQAPQRSPDEGKVAQPSGTTADFYFQKGLHFMKTKHLVQASNDFSRAIEIDPGHELSYYWRGVTNYKMNNHSKALLDFTNAIRLRQNDIYYHWRGVTYFRLNNYYMAVNDFTQALRIRPNNIDYRWRGACYHRLGKQMEADADFAMASRYEYERGSVRGGPER